MPKSFLKTIAFIGPSLTRNEIDNACDVQINAPIRRGDLAKCGNFDIIVIIDGEFAQSLSVSPKEILSLLEQRKVVIGASSMGALRASELNQFGMIGVGWVYERFVKATVRMDDDVALCYSPIDFTPLTVPMVDIEYWLDGLVCGNVISQRNRRTALHMARNIFYADRTTARVQEILESLLGSAIKESLGMEGGCCVPSIKALDAKRALDVAMAIASGRNPA